MEMTEELIARKIKFPKHLEKIKVELSQMFKTLELYDNLLNSLAIKFPHKHSKERFLKFIKAETWELEVMTEDMRLVLENYIINNMQKIEREARKCKKTK